MRGTRRTAVIIGSMQVITAVGMLHGPATLLAQRDSTVRVPAYRARVLGVFDEATGDPIDSVQVTDILTGTSALTTKTGTVSLLFLPDGGSLVRLRKLGYAVQVVPVSISPADTTPVTLILAHVTELPAVVTRDSVRRYISPGLRSFEERRHQGFGYFITDSLLRKNESTPLGNLLLPRFPGISVSIKGSRLSCGRGGAPTICLDGVPTRGANLDFQVGDLGGVEFYQGAATVPVEFNATGGGGCVLLLWTRER